MKYKHDSERDLHQSTLGLIEGLPITIKNCVKRYIGEMCIAWSRKDSDFVIVNHQELANLRNELIYLMGGYIESPKNKQQ
jgi:hypothetical protein